MIEFSQANDISEMFTPNLKDRPMSSWSDQTSSTHDICDEIDEIMKHEHEDVILLDEPLSVPPLDLDLDSISDLLESSSSSAITSTKFTHPLNINDLQSMPTPFTFNNNSRSTTTTTSAYSSLGISPVFTTLSLNTNNPFQQFIQSNHLHLPPFVHQQDSSILGTSYPFELQTNTSGQSDVKRFRSASMNDGPSLQPPHQKFDLRVLDPYPLKSSTYGNPFSYQDKPTSPIDAPSNPVWCPRQPSNSFSEVENQQQQLRLKSNLSSSFNGSSTLRCRKQTRFPDEIKFQPQTLYSINQSTNEDSTPPTRKRSSLIDFPVEEIKDEQSNSSYTMEQHSEPDLWSDIEQNSSDHIQDNDNTSDDETGVSTSHTLSLEGNPLSSSSSLFWQYNVQSKGPKTKRILYLKERDPHLYREFSDPVYQIKLNQTKGHSFNKLRKGDGNDVTPNPLKLYQLGKQIRDLSNNSSSVYHGIYHVDHHTNSNDTAEVKKEKNKIASRACRLRKKAQHEANKLKLHGLNEEHKSLIDVIASIKLIILKRHQDGQLVSPPSSPAESLETALDQLIANKCQQSVAGNSDRFVQTIINDMELLYTPKEQRSYSLNA